MILSNEKWNEIVSRIPDAKCVLEDLIATLEEEKYSQNQIIEIVRMMIEERRPASSLVKDRGVNYSDNPVSELRKIAAEHFPDYALPEELDKIEKYCDEEVIYTEN